MRQALLTDVWKEVPVLNWLAPAPNKSAARVKTISRVQRKPFQALFDAIELLWACWTIFVFQSLYLLGSGILHAATLLYCLSASPYVAYIASSTAV